LTPVVRPDLIIGTETGDDAGVWRLSPDRALVVTADFITGSRRCAHLGPDRGVQLGL
jgi:hypothetical protein